MISAAYQPAPPLSDFIACIWFQRDYLPQHPRERALPDGAVEFIINLDKDWLAVADKQTSRFEQASGSLIYGPHTEFFLIDTSIATSILGVHFRPGGVFPFLGLPAGELHNSILPLEVFWGTQVEALRERLLAAQSLAAQFLILETFLKGHLSNLMTRHPAVDYALHNFNSPARPSKVAEVLDRIGLSSRYLSQLFREQVGITPKAYHRLCRFQNTLQRIAQTAQPDWAALALECGYFDQAHFIHDFKAFSGLTPLEYHLQEGKRPGHVPAIL